MRSLAPDDIGFDDLAVDEDEEEDYEIARDDADDPFEDRDASAGTLAGVPAVANPDPFAFAAPPPLVSPTKGPIVYNDITSPFDKPWDLSLKADQARWIAATEADSDHKRFDISVATAHAFIELVQDKSEFYRWSPLMCVPVDGDGYFDRTTNALANGEQVMRINFLQRYDLLTKWTSVPLKACQQFAQWFNGDDAMRLDTPFAPHLTRKVVSLDCNAAGNIGLVRRFKVQLRIIDQLVLNVLKNHITVSSYKSFLAHKVDFSFIEEKTGQPLYSGLILLRKMMDVCKPETIVEVRHLEQQLETITLWPGHENNVRLLTTKMMTILQEIHAKTGASSYTDQRFITNLFRAVSTSPTEKFQTFIDTLKSNWIMEEISDPAAIILKMDKMHRNMVADGTWSNTNEKDTKIVALTSALDTVKKRFGELAKKVGFSSDGKGEGGAKNNNGGDGKKGGTQNRCPPWQKTKKGNTITQDGKKYIWCPHHVSKDGTINGLYMAFPHDHDAWAVKKADRNKHFREKRERQKEAKSSEAAAGSTKKPKSEPTGEKLKLALSDKLTSALVTQYHLSQTEADDLFKNAYKEAQEN